MSVALVAFSVGNVDPSRLKKHYSLLEEVYSDIIVPTIWQTTAHAIKALPDWKVATGNGGISGLMGFLKTRSEYVHYIDLDRLLCWIETNVGEWKATVNSIQENDVTVICRTRNAFETFPLPSQETQWHVRDVLNILLEYHLENKYVWDVASGTMWFSRKIVEFLILNDFPLSLGMADGYCSSLEYQAKWLVFLKQGGFDLKKIDVNGLIWERTHFYTISLDETSLEKSQEFTSGNDWVSQVRIANHMIQYAIEAKRKEIKLR